MDWSLIEGQFVLDSQEAEKEGIVCTAWFDLTRLPAISSVVNSGRNEHRHEPAKPPPARRQVRDI